MLPHNQRLHARRYAPPPPAVSRRLGGSAETQDGGAPQPRASDTVIPYDYAARFELTGEPGRVLQDAINVSADGVFVAVAVGYGLDEQRGTPISLTSQSSETGAIGQSMTPTSVRLGELPIRALIDGVRTNPAFHHYVFQSDWLSVAGRSRVVPPPEWTNQPLPPYAFFAATGISASSSMVLERVKPAEDISFLFNVLDSGSGRELQDEPIHNLASLGKSNGVRPFRLLAQPLTFAPRSSVRVQVIEQSNGTRGTLFIVFYGYKILTGGCGEAAIRSIAAAPDCPIETIGRPSDRVVPFDYVARLELLGQPRRRVETEVAISAEGAFVATAIGYGLAVASRKVDVYKQFDAETTDLRDLTLGDFPPDALVDGIRIHPDLRHLGIANNGSLAAEFPAALIGDLFERANRPEDVSFRYLITDGGRGIEMQNQFIHNVAGLGIADGDRPFKRFARPMIFGPRSTIRVAVEESLGRGTLQLVFHGYKVFGRAGATTS